MDVILTHEHADFDALASLVAAHKVYRQAVPLLPRQINRNLQEFLSLYGDAFPLQLLEDWQRRPVERVILVDSQSLQGPRGIRATTTVLVIDHHAQSSSFPPGWQYEGEPVGANTTLLVEKIIHRHISVTPMEATLFLLGIYEDTGMLLYQSSTPRDARAVAWLLEKGGVLESVRHFLVYPLNHQQRVLYDQLIQSSNMLTVKGHAILVATAETKELVDEISTLAHKMRNLFEPTALFLLVKMGDRIQLVARSSHDSVDVGAISRQLGGGGHSRAAAAVIRPADLPAAQRRLLQLLRQEVRPAMTVADLMSMGVQILNANESIAEAAKKMNQYGFEGFPVIGDAGKLLGMLTRRQVDRALHHGLGRSPVRLYMSAGHFTVHPTDAVSRLRRLVAESGWGQVPVVDEKGLVIGIVTRTDLIKSWQLAPVSSRAEEIVSKMTAGLPSGLLKLLRLLGVEADETGLSIYAVGGFVRDLLLGRPNFDVDLVVEQDAIALAEHVAAKYGGRIRRHHRFGTAKWILPPLKERPADFPTGEGLPETIDLVTARTEFYEHPTALPTVERSSIKLDLLRRDFTINTMAIRLNQQHWGELLDFFGGEEDLRRGIIRVLHSLSFVEDPTRIMRAVRFEQRFDFHMEKQTEALIADALGLLKRVSGARIRHELDLILQEQMPELALQRLDRLGVLRVFHPTLRCDPWIHDRFQRLRQRLMNTPPPDAIERLYFTLMLYHQPVEVAEALTKRLALRSATRKLLTEVSHLRERLPELQEEELSNSEIATLLRPYHESALLIVDIATGNTLISQRIRLYLSQLRDIKPYTDGHRLRILGVRPGPRLGRILAALRDAWLDGEVTSQEEEEQFLQMLLAEEDSSQPQRKGGKKS